MTSFEPNRTAALMRLHEFLPRAGRAYASGRNTDTGPGTTGHVSGLSPYIRHRVLSEEEVLRSVLNRHSAQAAEKFIQEVFWRTYWKGWLELRPGVWRHYQAGVARALDEVQTQEGLRYSWEAACKGQTGIACFDAWARELVDTGYLHNHARMWFASIWTFTLRLPWELGADFFLRHLLDGDPASNTLSWRWVAGIQTPGKTYLARPDNIVRHTEGRFHPAPGELASMAPPVPGPPVPDRQPVPVPDILDTDKPSVLLLHEDDLDPGWILSRGVAPLALGVLAPQQTFSPLLMSPKVLEFRKALMADAADRWSSRLGPAMQGLETTKDIAQWARDHGAQQIVTVHAPTGPVADLLAGVTEIPVIRLQRPYDQRAWPHATAGFFKFRNKIPDFLAAL